MTHLGKSVKSHVFHTFYLFHKPQVFDEVPNLLFGTTVTAQTQSISPKRPEDENRSQFNLAPRRKKRTKSHKRLSPPMFQGFYKSDGQLLTFFGTLFWSPSQYKWNLPLAMSATRLLFPEVYGNGTFCCRF